MPASRRRKPKAQATPAAIATAAEETVAAFGWQDKSTPLTYQNVRQALVSAFSRLVPIERIVISDTRYLTIPVAPVLQLIHSDPFLSPGAYRSEVFDCDDYVMYVKTKLALYAQQHDLAAPLALGFALTVEHAFTVGIADEGVFLIDTQSDTTPVATDPSVFAAFMRLTSGNIIQFLYI
jgi:hypothetical protein